MRHLSPTPRISIGRCLVRDRVASSAIDLSDGLSGDIRHLCQSSKVGVDIHTDALPLSPQCHAYAIQYNLDPIQLALTGGEDYELAFTIPPNNQRKLERILQCCAIPITCIGVITPRRLGIRVTNRDGSSGKLPNTSFRTFSFVTYLVVDEYRMFSMATIRSQLTEVLHLQESPHRIALAFFNRRVYCFFAHVRSSHGICDIVRMGISVELFGSFVGSFH